MDFSKTYKLESKAYPGVVVTLGRLGPKLRAAIELKLAEPRAREREVAMRRDFAEESLKALLARSAKDPDGKVIESELSVDVLKVADELLGLKAELENIQRALIHPAYVQAAVKGFNAELTYEGQVATADLLCEYGPDDLFSEVVRAVHRNGYLSQEQVENLSSPTTSVAAVDGVTETTSATIAESAPAYPSSGAASSTIPSE
jgi:hypothetical protein